MRNLAVLVVLCACWAASGCATALQGLALMATARPSAAHAPFSEFVGDERNYSVDEAVEPAEGFVAATDEAAAHSAYSDDLSVDAPPDAELPAAEPLDYVAALAPLDNEQAPFAPGPDLLVEPDAFQEPAFDTEVEPVAFEEPELDDAKPLTGAVAVAYDEQPTGEVEPTAAELTEAELTAAEPPEVVPADSDDYFVIADQGEVIDAPQPEYEGPFKPREEETNIDRFTRRVADVPLDIRPTEGAMPGDPAAARFAEQAQADPRQTGDVPGIVCSYTPWTMCFRPLYFEDIALERYGERVRFFQPALSGARFFASVAALPYKMRVHPPRSCVCSNGFSRCGDCPLPGYIQCGWRWDAAAIEAAAVTGFVFILP